MTKPEVKEIKSDQLALYREFLNNGLINDEEQFRITVQDDLNALFPTKDKEDSFTLGAYVDEALAGVVSFTRDGADREKLRHKGILFRMYVAGDYRGQGIAQKLISVILSRVSRINDVEQINLTVIAGNERAKALYERSGFETFGYEKNAIKWKGKYFDEEQMMLKLK